MLTKSQSNIVCEFQISIISFKIIQSSLINLKKTTLLILNFEDRSQMSC